MEGTLAKLGVPSYLVRIIQIFQILLCFHVPQKGTLISFVDNQTMVVIKKHLEDVKVYKNETICAIKASLQLVKLNLAKEKPVAILITLLINAVKIRVGNSDIVPKLIISYMEAMIDAKLNLKGTWTMHKLMHLSQG